MSASLENPEGQPSLVQRQIEEILERTDFGGGGSLATEGLTLPVRIPAVIIPVSVIPDVQDVSEAQEVQNRASLQDVQESRFSRYIRKHPNITCAAGVMMFALGSIVLNANMETPSYPVQMEALRPYTEKLQSVFGGMGESARELLAALGVSTLGMGVVLVGSSFICRGERKPGIYPPLDFK